MVRNTSQTVKQQLRLHYDKLTSESASDGTLKVAQHLAKLQQIKIEVSSFGTAVQYLNSQDIRHGALSMKQK